MKTVFLSIFAWPDHRWFKAVACLGCGISAVLSFTMATWDSEYAVFVWHYAVLGVSMSLLSISFFTQWNPFHFGEKS